MSTAKAIGLVIGKLIDRLLEGLFTALGIYIGLLLIAKLVGLPLIISFGASP